LIVLGVLVALACGCGGHKAPRLTHRVVTAAEWKSVLRDWYPDGRVDHTHSCGAILVAMRHLPSSPPMYSTVTVDLDRAARRLCTQHPSLTAIHRGMTDADVAAVAGAPRLPPGGCWLYPVTREHDGRRVCFTRGHVSLLQFSVHG
jgi:hypothetical protein